MDIFDNFTRVAASFTRLLAIALFAALAGCAHMDAASGRDKFVPIGEAVPDTYFDFPVK